MAADICPWSFASSLRSCRVERWVSKEIASLSEAAISRELQGNSISLLEILVLLKMFFEKLF
jgi:hypothetical protein